MLVILPPQLLLLSPVMLIPPPFLLRRLPLLLFFVFHQIAQVFYVSDMRQSLTQFFRYIKSNSRKCPAQHRVASRTLFCSAGFLQTGACKRGERGTWVGKNVANEARASKTSKRAHR